MRTSKAWLLAGNEHFLTRVVRLTAQVVQPVVVSARPDQELPPLPEEVRVVPDAIANAGPLAGLAAGLQALSDTCDAAFVASCDHPLITTNFIRNLIDHLGSHSGVVPKDDSRSYPLLAVYRTSVLTTLTDMLAASELRVHDFAARCGAASVDARDLCNDADSPALLNINTEHAYATFCNYLNP